MKENHRAITNTRNQYIRSLCVKYVQLEQPVIYKKFREAAFKKYPTKKNLESIALLKSIL